MRILIEFGAAPNPLWELVPVVVGAIIGAVAGAVPSYLLANRSAREAEKRDETERVRLNKTSARSAAFKLQKIVNGLATINSQLDKMLLEVEQAGIPDTELWKRFIPIGGMSPEFVRFETSQLALLYDAVQPKLANEMLLVAERHYAADLALFEYSTRHRALSDRVVVGSAEGLSEEQVFSHCAPIIAELSSTAPQIRDTYRKDQDIAIDVFQRYTEAMQALFKSPDFLKLEIVDEKV